MKHNHLSTPRKIAAIGRQILLPALVFFLLLSCSKDDDSDPGIIPVPIPAVPSFLKVTIDGTQYTFDRFVVEQHTVVEPDHSYVDLKVTATIVADPTKQIIFNLEQNVPGTETVYYFYINNNEVEYDVNTTFSTNVTVNANKRIIGTFSGSLDNFDASQTIELQSGSFDISY